MEEITLVYMVAGLSSRFGGKIKQFAKVPSGQSVIELSLSQALPAGFTKIIFIVGDKTETPFKKMFGDNYKGIPVEYAYQRYNPEARDKPWGTCDALCSARDLLNCPFVVCTADDIHGSEVYKSLFNHLKEKKSNASPGNKLITVIPETGEVCRGIITADENNNIVSIDESFNISRLNFREKDLSENSLTNMGIFALMPQTLKLLCDIVDKFKEDNKGNRTIECLQSNEIGKLIKNKQIEMTLYPTNEQWYGVTNPGDETKIKIN